MNHFSRILIFSSFAALIFWSCNTDTHRKVEYYVINVDSIQVPDTVSVSQTFKLQFFGTIGNNGCYFFDRFEVERQSNTVSVQVIGKYQVGRDGMCPEILPFLDEKFIHLKADSIGEFFIEVKNPGLNQYLNKTIQVLP